MKEMIVFLIFCIFFAGCGSSRQESAEYYKKDSFASHQRIDLEELEKEDETSTEENDSAAKELAEEMEKEVAVVAELGTKQSQKLQNIYNRSSQKSAEIQQQYNNEMSSVNQKRMDIVDKSLKNTEEYLVRKGKEEEEHRQKKEREKELKRQQKEYDEQKKLEALEARRKIIDEETQYFLDSMKEPQNRSNPQNMMVGIKLTKEQRDMVEGKGPVRQPGRMIAKLKKTTDIPVAKNPSNMLVTKNPSNIQKSNIPVAQNNSSNNSQQYETKKAQEEKIRKQQEQEKIRKQREELLKQQQEELRRQQEQEKIRKQREELRKQQEQEKILKIKQQAERLKDQEEAEAQKKENSNSEITVYEYKLEKRSEGLGTQKFPCGTLFRRSLIIDREGNTRESIFCNWIPCNELRDETGYPSMWTHLWTFSDAAPLLEGYWSYRDPGLPYIFEAVKIGPAHDKRTYYRYIRVQNNSKRNNERALTEFRQGINSLAIDVARAKNTRERISLIRENLPNLINELQQNAINIPIEQFLEQEISQYPALVEAGSYYTEQYPEHKKCFPPANKKDKEPGAGDWSKTKTQSKENFGNVPPGWNRIIEETNKNALQRKTAVEFTNSLLYKRISKMTFEGKLVADIVNEPEIIVFISSISKKIRESESGPPYSCTLELNLARVYLHLKERYGKVTPKEQKNPFVND